MKIIITVCLMTIIGCNSRIPRSLDGKIVTDEKGRKIKLEWIKGWGESWRFLEEYTVCNKIKGCYSEWKYLDD